MKHKSAMNRYHKLKKKKICVDCGKVPALKYRVKCEKCRDKAIKRNRELRKKKVRYWKIRKSA
jgi:hypothetical protein